MNIENNSKTKQEQIPEDEKQIEKLALTYLETGRSIDVVHT